MLNARGKLANNSKAGVQDLKEAIMLDRIPDVLSISHDTEYTESSVPKGYTHSSNTSYFYKTEEDEFAKTLVSLA